MIFCRPWIRILVYAEPNTYSGGSACELQPSVTPDSHIDCWLGYRQLWVSRSRTVEGRVAGENFGEM